MQITTYKKNVIKLFHKVYLGSKAYRNFVNNQSVNIGTVNTIKDIDKIPVMNKKNYINKYSIQDRMYENKELSNFYMLCTSSGVTGQPTIWPRDLDYDMQLEKLQYKLYQEHFDISNKKTLCLVAFALGPYTAGVLTSKLSWPINLYNNFSVVSIGMNRDILLSLINELKDNYDQIIIIGYPPFIVDFIEYVEDKDISIKDIGLKIMYTSERVSESLRNLIASKISSSSNRYDVVGFYACSDAGIIGYETKSIIKLLDRIKDNKKFNIKTFGSIDPPTLVKLDLDSGKYIESVNGEIVITTDQPVPLIRYAIKDRGGVMTGAELKKRLESFCIDFSDLQIHDYYVFVLGRADAVKLTANIYIDDIKYCLEKSIYSNRLSKNFKYGLIKSSNLRNKLKIIVYYKDSSEGFTKKEQEYFAKDFYTNLENSNQDYKVIKEGLKLESFEFSFEKDNNYKFQDSKLKYFL